MYFLQSLERSGIYPLHFLCTRYVGIWIHWPHVVIFGCCIYGFISGHKVLWWTTLKQSAIFLQFVSICFYIFNNKIRCDRITSCSHSLPCQLQGCSTCFWLQTETHLLQPEEELQLYSELPLMMELHTTSLRLTSVTQRKLLVHAMSLFSSWSTSHDCKHYQTNSLINVGL